MAGSVTDHCKKKQTKQTKQNEWFVTLPTTTGKQGQAPSPQAHTHCTRMPRAQNEKIATLGHRPVSRARRARARFHSCANVAAVRIWFQKFSFCIFCNFLHFCFPENISCSDWKTVPVVFEIPQICAHGIKRGRVRQQRLRQQQNHQRNQHQGKLHS